MSKDNTASLEKKVAILDKRVEALTRIVKCLAAGYPAEMLKALD